jgi:glucokinase
MITVGTGIGTAFIFDGKIYRGTGGTHPEGGHILIDPSGPDCYCGARGCWESLASGTAIGAFARELAAREPSLLLQKAGNNLEKIDAILVACAAREGCPLSLKVIDRAATYLGLGLVSLLQLFLPDGIIFTGGVTRSYDLFEPYLTRILAQHSVMQPLDKIPLRMAKLGQQAGMYGAARAAMLLVASQIV